MKKKLSSNSKAELKFQRVMSEFAHGKLISHNIPVTDQKQALAIAFSEARKLNPDYGKKSGGGKLDDIYSKGSSQQLWQAWDEKQRAHFLTDHMDLFMQVMGKDPNGRIEKYKKESFFNLPTPIRLEIAIHHAMGLYDKGGIVTKSKSKITPAKKKIQDRIIKLKAAVAGIKSLTAKKSIQKKIDKLQSQFDYNPGIKEKIAAQKGRFYLDVPTQYAKAIYRKLWSMGIKPELYKLNGNTKVVVNNSKKLEKAYKIYSDILSETGEQIPKLSKIQGKIN